MNSQLTILNRLFYSLQGAVKQAGCESHVLLNAGAEGKLRLCILVPKNKVVIFAIERNWLPKIKASLKSYERHSYRKPQPGAGEPADELHSLLLSCDDCQEILNVGTIDQELFYFGYKVNGTEVTVMPNNLNEKSDPIFFDWEGLVTSEIVSEVTELIPIAQPTLIFASYNTKALNKHPLDDQYLEPIRITEENIFIYSNELFEFIASNSHKATLQCMPDDLGINQRSWSEKLQKLVKAQDQFWRYSEHSDEVQRELKALYVKWDKSCNPDEWKVQNESIKAKDQKIYKWLSGLGHKKNGSSKLIQFFPTPTALNGAVNIIKPDVLRSSQQVSAKKRGDNPNKPIHFSRYLDALIKVASDESNLPIQKRADTINFLMMEHGFTENMAKVGAMIIRQENAAKGRPKK